LIIRFDELQNDTKNKDNMGGMERAKTDEREGKHSEKYESDEDDVDVGGTDEDRRLKIHNVTQLMRQYFNETEFTEEDVNILIEECYKVCGRTMGE
jgi:hypothetical protein